MSVNVDGAKASKVLDGAGSGTGITVRDSGAVTSRCMKVSVDSTAMAAAGTTTLTLWTPPQKCLVRRVLADVRAVFTGGTLSAMTVQVGVSGTANKYLAAGSVFAGATQLGDVVAEIGAGCVDASRADTNWTSTAIQALFTATGDNCNAATQGVVDFYILVDVLP